MAEIQLKFSCFTLVSKQEHFSPMVSLYAYFILSKQSFLFLILYIHSTYYNVFKILAASKD